MGKFQAAKTHCKNGHLFTDKTTYVTPKGRRECRVCRNANVRRFKMTGTLTTKTADRIVESLKAGFTLKNILYATRGRSGEKIPGMLTTDRSLFLNHMRDFPEFARIVTPMAERNAFLAQSRGALASCAKRSALATPPILPEKFWTDGHHTYETVRQATSNIRSYDMRQEVMSAMFIAIEEGTLLTKDARAKVSEFIRGYWRENGHSVMSRFGNFSLDAPLFDDSGSNRYDFISEEQRLWG